MQENRDHFLLHGSLPRAGRSKFGEARLSGGESCFDLRPATIAVHGGARHGHRSPNLQTRKSRDKGGMSGQEIAGIFVKALPRIKRLCAKAAPPLIARVSQEGGVSLIA
jgi:hypothetical protein